MDPAVACEVWLVMAGFAVPQCLDPRGVIAALCRIVIRFFSEFDSWDYI
jgi:hypothetical protein